MKQGAIKSVTLLLAASCCFAQTTFQVTGTAIPQSLAQENYGKMPTGIAAYDLNICNVTNTKQSVVSSAVYQALAASANGLQPIGRQIMLAPILRNRDHSAGAIAGLILNSATGVFSALAASNRAVAPAVLSGAAIASMAAQSVLSHLAPVLTNDELQRFESEALEPALVLDGGSCVERTVFALSANPKEKAQSLSFHVR